MKITRSLAIVALTSLATSVNAQQFLGGYFYGQDAFRYSEVKSSGTARMQGIGGGYSALGADATNAFSNPAGLGFYNRSELSITPVFNSLNSTSNYIGTSTNLASNGANIGQLAFILSNNGIGTRKKRSTLGISYSKQVNFLSNYEYAGSNRGSSMMDFFAEKATRRGANSTTLDNEFDPNRGIADTPTAMYYQTFMIDPNAQGNAPYKKVESSLPVNQNGAISSKGSLNQWNFSYGVNYDDKTYLGFSVGLIRLNYEYLGKHEERFPSGRVFNGFNFEDDLTTRGSGINLTVGGIIKATDNIQLGASVTTPTWLTLTETYNSAITIDQKANTFTTDFKTVSTLPNDFPYKITTPLRANGGATFFLPNKLGFISADAEFVGYRGMNVSDSEDASWSSDQKKAITNTFNNVVNLKAGTELRFDNFRVRGGVKYMPDPYKLKANDLDRSQMVFSIGGGYRTSKFYVDAAGVFNKFVAGYTPYELSDASRYASAKINTTRTDFVVSVGTFF
ncbi:MAG: hypothetical protein ACK4NY_18995 [Spirosomataceae bacterium]